MTKYSRWGENLPDEEKTNRGDSIISPLIDTHKRKKINRIKTSIIVTIIILFLIPTLLCILLGMRLSQLQKQVDTLFSTYSSKDEPKDKNKNNGQYAYASETDNPTNNKTDTDSNDNTDSVTGNDDEAGNMNEGNNIEGTGNEGNTGSNSEGAEGEGDTGSNMEGTGSEGDANNTDGTGNEADTGNDIEGTENIPDDEDVPDEELIYKGKKVYLTFDDGPTKHTDEVLDILKEYGVKATFFVIGHDDDTAKKRYNRIIDEGHVLGMHSYSHNYKQIYKSVEDFDKDFTKLWNLLYDTTGYKPTLFRFPGGSLNFVGKNKMKKFISYVTEKGMTYYDWNVVNGDAEGINYTEEQMIENVLNGVAKKTTCIVLMHDGAGHEKTVNTLPKVLEALISGGAEVLPIDENVPLIQQIKVSSIK